MQRGSPGSRTRDGAPNETRRWARAMAHKLLFLTGRLAEPRLTRTVADLGLPDGSWRIANVGVKVAALMTEAIVRNRLKAPLEADRVIVPGRARMNLAPVEGPLRRAVRARPRRDRRSAAVLRQGRQAARPVALRHAHLRRDRRGAAAHASRSCVARARRSQGKGADIIDIGCQPDTPFPHLEEVVRALAKARLQGQRRFRQRRGIAPRGAGRRRLRAEPR